MTFERQNSHLIHQDSSDDCSYLVPDTRKTQALFCEYLNLLGLTNKCDPPCENRPCSHLVVIRETGI